VRLAGDQPVHGRIEIVLIERAELEFFAQAVVASLRPEGATGGEFGSRFEDARGNESQGEPALAAGVGVEDEVQVEVADGGEDSGDMAVRERAGDLEGGLERGRTGVVALEEAAEGVDLCGRPMREVGEGAVVDLTVLAKGLAEQSGRRGVAVGDDGHVHVDMINESSRIYKSNMRYYMTTLQARR
jgi:hypothetical protein